jgi:hypothetical protein
VEVQKTIKERRILVNIVTSSLCSTEEAMTFLVDKVIHFKTQETSNDSIILQDTSDCDIKYKSLCCG